VAFQFKNNTASATNSAETRKMKNVRATTSRQPNNLDSTHPTTKNQMSLVPSSHLLEVSEALFLCSPVSQVAFRLIVVSGPLPFVNCCVTEHWQEARHCLVAPRFSVFTSSSTWEMMAEPAQDSAPMGQQMQTANERKQRKQDASGGPRRRQAKRAPQAQTLNSRCCSKGSPGDKEPARQ
jgi:hypothetical protein